ncbi:MAG TPA: Gfo/Idh/MocA family oxidoreductase [Candidatus Dormibacteraeota bacterium]
MKIVIAGAAANILSAHRRGLDAVGAEVVAVQDVNVERARTVAAELGARFVPDLDALWREDADLALILTPHPFHAPMAIAALRAGKHVLVEKPLAVSAADQGRSMVAEAERAGRVLAVCFQQRTRTEVVEARRLIAAGFLGRLQRAEVLATWPRRRAYFESAPWRGTWRGEGGGVLINQGQHDLDLLVHLAGPPARVFAKTPTRLHEIETEDSVQALLEWENGALGSVHISTVEVDESQRIELTGTRGRLRLLPGRLETVANEEDFEDFRTAPGGPFDAPRTGEVQTFEGGGGDHADLYRDLAEALTTGRPPIAPGREALRTLELANAIQLSGRTGREVAIPDELPAAAAAP